MVLLANFTRIGLLAAGLLVGGGRTTFAQAFDLQAGLDPLIGTLDVSAQPIFSQGEVSGCQFVFDALVRDWEAPEERMLKVSGSTGLMGAPNNVVAGFVKIIVREWELSSPEPELVPSAPQRVYLVGSDFSTNFKTLISTSPTDVEGGLFAMFRFSPTFNLILDAMARKTLSLSFNRRGGAIDRQLDVKLDVVSTDQQGLRTRSDDATKQFAGCAAKLLRSSNGAAQVSPTPPR